MAQGFSIPDASLRPTHLSIRRGRATTTHYTRHQVSLMVSRKSLPWGCTLGQPVRQASALACEESVCQPKGERNNKVRKDWFCWQLRHCVDKTSSSSCIGLSLRCCIKKYKCSSAVAKRPRDASCLSVVSFNSTKRRV